MLAAVGGFIQRGDVDNAVGVNIKGHFDLWDASGGSGDAVKHEFAQGLVICGHGAFALQHVNLNLGL